MRPDSNDSRGDHSNSHQHSSPSHLSADHSPHQSDSAQKQTAPTVAVALHSDTGAGHGHGHFRRATPLSSHTSDLKSVPKSTPAFNTDRISAYKRARTVSPVIDEFGSDAEQEARSTYSRSNSDLGELDNVDPPLLQAQQQFPTPLRESISSAEVADSFNIAMLQPDHTIEALMQGKSLSLDDQAIRGTREVAMESDEQPTYKQALARSSVESEEPSSKPSGKEQLDIIQPMKNRPLHAGDVWFLVGRGWYRRWNAVCSGQLVVEDGEQEDPLGPVDNTALLDEDSSPAQAHLKPRIAEHLDYEMVPEEGWTILTQWYGSKGPVFARKVIEGNQPGQESIEFYPPIIRLLRLVENDLTESLGLSSFSLSVSCSLTSLKAKAKAAFGLGPIPDTDLRFWFLPEPTEDEFRSGVLAVERTSGEGIQCIDAGEDRAETYSDSVTLKALGIDEIEVILAVETRLSGRWTSDQSSASNSPAKSNKNVFSQQEGDFFSNLQQNGTSAASSSTSGESLGRSTRSQTAMDRTLGRSRGLRGLNNLGNTCFMNSALQCMSNTYELQQYFVSGVYREELNTDNPLGMGGAIAEAFGSLITNIWNGQGGSFWPREFKFALSRFAPQFSGYAQHDSQELLAFLLDGLHEDLNRILKKPYIEAPDWEGGDERDLVAFAKRQWDIYKARNDSVIVDLFQGQYRSTLVCPVCNKVSIKFDPFMYLTLPIPNKKMWKGHVYFVPLSVDLPTQKLELQLPAGFTVGQLRQKVAARFNTESKRLVCGEVWHREIYKYYEDYEPLLDIKAADYVYFWELAGPARLPTLHQPSYRHHRSIEEAETHREFTSEDYAILPVFSIYESNIGGASTSSKSTYTGRRAKSDMMGIPFFIAIPERDVNDPEAIQTAVMNAYLRYADDKDILAAAFRASIEPISDTKLIDEAGASISEWEMIDERSRSETAVELVTSAETPSDAMVTEIREDGEAVVVPDLASRLGEQFNTDRTMIVEDSSKIVCDDRSEKPSAFSDLSIRFGISENGNGIYKGGSISSEHLSEELFERSARLSRAMQLDAETHPDALDPAEQPRGGKRFLPLVYTGGALFCSWSRASADSIFTESESGQSWGLYENVLDETLRNETNAGSVKPKAMSIEDCMDEFTNEEQLGEDDPWFCPSCKDFRQATKKFDLWKVPDILVVHLKRFSAGRHSRDKLNVMVDFPLEGLDLTERVEGLKAVRRVQKIAEEAGEELSESMLGSGILRPLEDNDDAVATDHPIYDLYAVDNHFGGLGGGHYTAYAKNPADGMWYNFDDSSVRPVSDPNSVRTSSAYLLFYRRRTTRPIGGKSRQKFQAANKTKMAVQPGAVTEHSQLSTVMTGKEDLMEAHAEEDSSLDDSHGWTHSFRGAEAEAAPGWTSSGGSSASSLRAMSPASERDSVSP